MEPVELSPYFCVICTKPIPWDRFKRKAVTCDNDCAEKLKMVRRKLRDARYCRLCNKPSTPEQREHYRRWIHAQPKERGRGRPKKTKPTKEVPDAESVQVIHHATDDAA